MFWVKSQCLEALQPLRNGNIEVIISSNGIYPNLDQYCDQYVYRHLDNSVGKTMNRGIRFAKGDNLILMANDILLKPGAVEECIEIVKNHPHHLSSPMYLNSRKYHEMPMVDGYHVNQRVGADCVCMTRKQFEDIGWFDEIMLVFDAVNYMNRWIKKGYSTILTKEIMATDLGKLGRSTNYRSYLGQAEQIGFIGYHSRRAKLNPTKEEVWKECLKPDSILWQTL